MEDKPFGGAISGLVTEDDTGVEGPNDKDCAASLILPQMFIKQESTKISLACY